MSFDEKTNVIKVKFEFAIVYRGPLLNGLPKPLATRPGETLGKMLKGGLKSSGVGTDAVSAIPLSWQVSLFYPPKPKAPKKPKAKPARKQ